MLIKADGQVYVRVTGVKFTVEDRFSPRDSHGNHGQVEIDTVKVTLYRLNDVRDNQYWAEGFRVRQDGSVGSRRASQVLLNREQLPAEVDAAITEAYITQVQHMSSEPGMDRQYGFSD